MLLIAFYSLLGCKSEKVVAASGANYQSSKTQILDSMPDHFRQSSDSLNNTLVTDNSIGSIDWRTYFTDPNLQSLLEKGVAYNSDLQIALQRIQMAELQLSQAKLLNLPKIDAGLSASYNRPSEYGLTGSSLSSTGSKHFEDYNLNASLSWEADIWGKIKNEKKSALALYLQSFEAKKAVQTKLVADIANGYYNLLMLHQQLKITKANLLLADSTLRLTKLLQQSGDATSLSVQQTEGQRASTAQLIPKLEQDISLQENALQLLTGSYPKSIDLESVLESTPMQNMLAVGIADSLVKNRPDVRLAEFNIDFANAQMGIAKANMYPSLTISANGGVEALKASNWFNLPGALFGMVAGGIAAPIFEAKALKTQYEVNKVKRSEAVTEFRQSVLNAVGEVSDAVIKSEKLKQQEQIASDRVAILKSAINNALLLYRSDMANYLEVISAQSSALQAELDLSAIHCLQLQTATELYRSLGGGWH